MSASGDIGEALAEEGSLADEVHDAIAHARSQGWSVVAYLTDAELVGEERLAEVAAHAVGSMVVDLGQGELDEGCVRLIPERLARRHLLVPIAPDEAGGRLRVAFADPLDAEAVQGVRDLTGLEVEPLVATVSDVRAAIRKAYERDTRVMDRPEVTEPPQSEPALVGETTKRLDHRQAIAAESEGEVGRVGTAPVHRIADEATAEQRHEALLLALIEAGVLTRAAYIDALRRLLGR